MRANTKQAMFSQFKGIVQCGLLCRELCVIKRFSHRFGSFVLVDDQKQKQMFVYNDKLDYKLFKEQREWVPNKITKPRYDETEGLLYFFDKYTTIVVGGTRAVCKYYKQNQGKLLLDKLSVSDIAYSIFVYESTYEIWKEEITKAKTCATAEQKKEFQSLSTAVLKYHVKRGTRLSMYQDGWTKDGQEYFKDLCREVEKLKQSAEQWNTLKIHWATYARKYHNTFTFQVEDNAAEPDEEESIDNDDGCLVSLPGERDDIEAFEDIVDDERDENVDMNEDEEVNNGVRMHFEIPSELENGSKKRKRAAV